MDVVLASLSEASHWMLETLASCCCPGDTGEQEDGERARLLGEEDR